VKDSQLQTFRRIDRLPDGIKP